MSDNKIDTEAAKKGIGISVGVGAASYAGHKYLDKKESLAASKQAEQAERSKTTSYKKVRRVARKKRHKRRLEKTRVRTKSMRKISAGRTLGVTGLALSAPSTIGEARDITKEGGSFSTRLGKFTEHMLGFPAGSSGRGMTEAERKKASQI